MHTIYSRWVYPRGCGGTAVVCRILFAPSGLSPRVRGNQFYQHYRYCYHRSIPAGAGEPQCTPASWEKEAVYPRGCGGTRHTGRRRSKNCGLSPRVRGNPEPGGGLPDSAWSIPAGAGEPSATPAAARTREVYPRGCGGTWRTARTPTTRTGLSPRVRGNRGRRKSASLQKGSIPAGAGEPGTGGASLFRIPVYPRGCGGTVLGIGTDQAVKGLSPRVRGNHWGQTR